MEKSVAAFADWVSRSHQRTEPAGNVQVLDASEVGMDGSETGETGGCQLPRGNSWEIDVLFWLAWAKYIYIYIIIFTIMYIYIIVTNGGYGHHVVWYMSGRFLEADGARHGP